MQFACFYFKSLLACTKCNHTHGFDFMAVNKILSLINTPVARLHKTDLEIHTLNNLYVLLD